MNKKIIFTLCSILICFIAVAQKHNIVNASIALRNENYSEAKNYIDMGYNLLNIGADVIALSDYAENLINEFEKINS